MADNRLREHQFAVKNAPKRSNVGFFNTIRPSDSNKRWILFKSLACYCCSIRDSLDTSAKVGLLKWWFSLFQVFVMLRFDTTNVKDTRPKQGEDLNPQSLEFSFFPRLVAPIQFIGLNCQHINQVSTKNLSYGYWLTKGDTLTDTRTQTGR